VHKKVKRRLKKLWVLISNPALLRTGIKLLFNRLMIFIDEVLLFIARMVAYALYGKVWTDQKIKELEEKHT
jgi:hypothetical protein